MAKEIKKKKTKKRQKWTKLRHRIVQSIAYAILYPYSRLVYGVRIEKFKDKRKRPLLILMNHQTAFDQFFLGMAFRQRAYYVASEDLFSKGFLSRVIRFLVAPIPIKKQTNDASAVMTCARVAREGATIALAPEGNRTYSGRLVYIKPSIVGLVRLLRLPVVLYRIEGGYGVHPRWSDVVRRGTMRCYVSEVIEPEEYKTLSDDELLERIRRGLDVDETKIEGEYRHPRLAEYLERAMYVCPDCGLSEFESNKDIVTCKRCGRQIRYLPNKQLEGIGFDFPYRYVADWYDYQQEFVSNLDVSDYGQNPIYRETAGLSQVILYDRKRGIAPECEIAIYNDRFTLTYGETETVLPFDGVSAVTVLGKNKLDIYFEDKVYQLKGDKRFNALKYVNLYYHAQSVRKGEKYGEFLGL